MRPLIDEYTLEIRALMLRNINSDIDQQLDAARTIILLQEALIKQLATEGSSGKEAA